MTTRTVLDAQVNLTLSHITTSVAGCTMYLLPSRDMPLYFQWGTIFCMTWSPMSKPSIWNCGDGFFFWRLCFCPWAPLRIRESWELWWLHEREDPLYHGYHSCLRPCISKDMSIKMHAGYPGKKFPSPEAQRQVSVSSQYSSSTTRRRAMISEDGPFIQTRYSLRRWWNPGWVGVIERSLHQRTNLMFGPVVTTEAHLAFSGSGAHSNDTAEMTAMIEPLSFLGLRGPVAQDEEPCFLWFQTRCWSLSGHDPSLTHMQVALACQRSMICAQHRLRLTVQHVYGDTGNLGNECAGHAAGLVTSHNVS